MVPLFNGESEEESGDVRRRTHQAAFRPLIAVDQA